ncbi:CoA-transferase family III [Cylindrobasidium torrendii FP15055 ss-10]|uniref:CoA-transferase family III n=1 Tax=Cylindrobasidium torrendii FP15055 ss-10 TaxID=1314674 RepID=A0A0D7BPP4_9AGAR|nr:CoA-transferase family III [Cylindrobasidium torrendii FP15055 ss-10]
MALAGLKVIELAGLAPGPFAGLILADNGADVVRVDRCVPTSDDILSRGKRSVALDLKSKHGRALLKRLICAADVLIDPFRPGVLEKMGVGPDVFLGKNGLNPRLIFARLVGFPRQGPHKNMAGHDINYLALSGIFSMLPGADKPSFPLNLVADFAGGGMTCALGILLALIQRGGTGRGQVVDTDMVSGTRYLSSFPLLLSMIPHSPFGEPRGENVLDGGAPFYDTYACEDGKWMSVGCLEPQFFAAFLTTFHASLDPAFLKTSENGWSPTPAAQAKREEWPRLRRYIRAGFKTRPRDYWAERFHGTDACTVPILNVQEAAELDLSGSIVPQPHPRIGHPKRDFELEIVEPGQHSEVVLREFGVSDAELRRLLREGAVQGLGLIGKAKM